MTTPRKKAGEGWRPTPQDPGVPVDLSRIERNMMLSQRGYFEGSCWECHRLKELQEVNLVKRQWKNGTFAGYVCPKHGGDNGPLEPIVRVQAKPDTTTPVQPPRRDG